MVATAFSATYMPTTTKQEILKGDIQDGHTYKIAFFGSTQTCDATFTAWSGTNEVSNTATGYSVGTSYTTAVSGTTAYIDDFSGEVANVITLSSATFSTNSDCTAANTPADCCTGSGTGTCGTTGATCGIIYNDTHASDQALIVFDISPAILPTAEDVTITFPTDDATNAIVRIQ